MLTEPRQAAIRCSGAGLRRLHWCRSQYAVTPSLTLTATVNPDFGQVEADSRRRQPQRVRDILPGKRPFFIEGSGTYQFECRDCNLFYSRRIGGSRAAIRISTRPVTRQCRENSTIVGAAKLTGRVRNFSVGVLTAATDDEEARAAFDGRIWREVAERAPLLRVASAARVQRSVVARVHFSPRRIAIWSTRCRSCPIRRSPAASTTTGGWDALGAERMGGSHVKGTPRQSMAAAEQRATAQRPDADHVDLDPLATSMGGHSATSNSAKSPASALG